MFGYLRHTAQTFGDGEIPKEKKMIISGNTLLGLVNKVYSAVLKDSYEGDPKLGALLEVEENAIKMASTDRHRVVVASVPIEGGTPGKIIIPRKGLDVLKKLLDDDVAGFAIHGNTLCVTSGSIEVLITGISGNFPLYDKVMPTTYDRRAHIDVADFVKLLKKLTKGLKKNEKNVVLEFRCGMLKVIPYDVLAPGESIPIDLRGINGAVGFNATYLLEALRHIDTPRVCLETRGQQDMALVYPEDALDYQVGLMPIRI
jgi:DNA polymerase-3 subunit beta